MFNRRLIPYFIVVGTAVLLSVCYMGYREYQKHVEFETFMAKVQATLDKDTNPPLVSSRTEQTESNQKPSNIPPPEDFMATYQRLSNMPSLIDALGKPVKVAVVSSDEADEEPVEMAELPPEIRALLPDPDAPMKLLRVQTPDGNIRVILVPAGIDYNAVDIALSEEIANSPAARLVGRLDRVGSVRDSEIPEGETAESYLNKMDWASRYGVSIEAVEKMMERGHIPQRNIIARSPVVEFSDRDLLFHSHDHDDRSRSGGRVDAALHSGEHRAEVPVSDGAGSEDIQHAPVRSDIPVSPSNLPDMVKPTPAPPNVADIENQLTPAGIEAELGKGLSPDRFDKAQQLIDQYGTEEGLRRLRESDPEAARQFERERRPVPSRDVPDEGQSESGSKD